MQQILNMFALAWLSSDIRPTSQGPQTHGGSVECILLRHLLSPQLLWSRNSIILAHPLFTRDLLMSVFFRSLCESAPLFGDYLHVLFHKCA